MIKPVHRRALRRTWMRLAIVLALVAFVLPHGLAQQPSDSSRWLVGADLLRQRQQPVTLSWSEVPLRDGLRELGKAQRVAILLDRRLDPEQPIDLTADRLPLDDLLARLAKQIDGGLAWLGPLAYIGPRDASARLRTLAALRAADVRALPKDERPAFQHEKNWRWEMLAQPRDLVTEMAAEANVEIESLELLSHDLWPAADLPPLAWTDRLTLLANEFDLTFELDDRSHVRLTPIQEPVVIERTYPGGKQAEQLAARWRELAPDAQIALARGKIIVSGRVEDHERFVQKKPPPLAPRAKGTESYTMTVRDQPLAAVLDKLRQQLSIDLRVDEAALEAAELTVDRRVSFSVEQASLDELLSAVLRAADLTYRREGAVYQIVPAKVANRSESQ